MTELKTYRNALQSPCSKQWEKAMSDKLAQLNETGTFVWVPTAPAGKTVIGSHWVLKEKCDAEGKLVKHKARIVAQGFSQVPGQDFSATYASVAKFTTFRTLLAIAA